MQWLRSLLGLEKYELCSSYNWSNIKVLVVRFRSGEVSIRTNRQTDINPHFTLLEFKVT